jgi:hypothetical protein
MEPAVVVAAQVHVVLDERREIREPIVRELTWLILR